MYSEIRTASERGKTDATVLLTPRPTEVKKADLPTEPGLAEAHQAAAARPEFAGETGEFVDISHDGRRVLVVGVGDAAKLDANQVRIAAAKLTESMHRRRITALTLATTGLAGLGPVQIGQAFAEGLGIGAFRYDRFKAADPRRPAEPKRLTIRSADADLRRGLDDGIRLAEATSYARELQATPPNIASPRYIGDQARQLAKSSDRLGCTVYSGDALGRQKFVGLMNVGKASDHKPCMIALRYRSKKRNAPLVVLVGKTLTFDSGGLSLKISNGMRNMKYDKSGGMAVLGAFHAIRNRDLPCHVLGLLPAAENAISDEAYRVDDIIEYPNGVSVEVTNTDAEGRLVLADALAYASRSKDRPDAIIDLATLTGGVVTALGEHTAGLFCKHDQLRDRVQQAAMETAEPVWPLPITTEHHDALKSIHADLTNSSLRPTGSPCVAAAFLERFVDAACPWAHLDIAGTATTEGNHPLYEKGPTAFGVRLLTHLLEGWTPIT